MSKDVNRRKSMKRAKIITEICISAVIIALGAYYVTAAVKRAEPIGSSPYIISAESSEEGSDISEPENDPNKIIFESLSVDTKNKFKGDLILVNNDHEYFSGNESLISLNAKLNEDGVTSYVGNDNDTQVLETIYLPLTDMLNDFNAATGYDDVVIIGGYRTYDRQQELYDEDLESTGLDYSDRVALPGHSEHESGYSVDFTTSTTWDYDGTGEYDWINQNCWKYGFILRYPEDKTDITNIKYEPWHYRYVGIPHAYYMYTNSICLEEYIDLLKDYSYEGEHLVFTDGNGIEYEIYYVPSDDGADVTYVPVPSSIEYEISGNNSDGFIVTVYKDQESDNSDQHENEGSDEISEPEDENNEDSSEE